MAIRILLQVDAIDPNMLSNGVTPLIEAIGNVRLSAELGMDPANLRINGVVPLIKAIDNMPISAFVGIDTVNLLINHPRVNVNQRGEDGKLPLQIAYERVVWWQGFFDAICRRSLKDCDIAVKNHAKDLMERLDCNGGRVEYIAYLLEDKDKTINVSDYSRCSIEQLFDAVHNKIFFLWHNLDNLPGDFLDRLKEIDDDACLIFGCITQRDLERDHLFSQLRGISTDHR